MPSSSAAGLAPPLIGVGAGNRLAHQFCLPWAKIASTVAGGAWPSTTMPKRRLPPPRPPPAAVAGARYGGRDVRAATWRGDPAASRLLRFGETV